MVMPISQENFEMAIVDAYAIAHILTLSNPSYLSREVAVFNEYSLRNWANHDPDFLQLRESKF